MKRVGIILTVLLVVVQVCSDNIWARPTTQQEAEKVVKGWLKASAQPLGAALGRQVTKIETYTDDNGNPLYYIVYLQPNGFVIVSADDLIEPIIGFAEDGIYDPSPANPLGALVTGDLNGRIESVRTGQPARTKVVTGVSTVPQNKWSKFIGLAEAPEKEFGTMGLSGIDDVRVPPLVLTRWRQSTICSSLACYNYYTPPYRVGGDRQYNYVCGCVATALAQIMRYHQYPTTGIGTNTFYIKINNGDPCSHSTRGGDGSGGAYYWDQMPLVPNSICGSITETQRLAIGALCHDAGVGISNLASDSCNPVQYTNYTLDNTTAYTHSAKVGLINTFKYSNAIYGFNGGNNITDGLIGMVNPNLDAGLPVYFGIKGTPGGHAIVCDGYGYNAGTMYHHLNMGWAGDSDAWYDLPDINSSPSYNTLYETIYNITKIGTGELISGRVTNPVGNPISDVNVYQIYYPGPSLPKTCYTNAKGIYSFYQLKSDSNIAVWADKTGYVFGDDKMVRTGKSNDMQSTSGNLWGVDFVCIAPDVNTMTPVSGPPGTYMKIQGAHFGSSPGWVIFPGIGYFGDILQWSDTLILCRVPWIPSSGNVFVRSSVGIDSNGVYFDLTNPTTIYVDVNHTPDIENGSISYPFSTIERGIYPTTYGDTVIVKPGVYNENLNFFGDWGITLTSTDPNNLDVVASTVIDGNANGAVVTFEYDSSVLTGFTITNGYTDEYGGGICCNSQGEGLPPTISHCLITSNMAWLGGGGISCCDNGPTISHCIIADNSASFGGGIDCNNSWIGYSPKISNCLIIGNSAYGGGGIYSTGGSPTISHCDFSSNNASAEDGFGGGIVCEDCNMIAHHTILWADMAPYGPEILIMSSANPSTLTVRYSDVQGGLAGVYQAGGSLHWDANNIINADPMFVRDPNPGPDGYWNGVDDDFGDLHLLDDSPCIDAGDPNFIPVPDANTDMDGQPRIVGCRVDIGADEFVYLGDIEPDGDVDLADFAAFAGYWQDTNCGTCGGADLTGDGKVDFADLAELAKNWLKSLCQD
jgi:hypothetical protein